MENYRDLLEESLNDSDYDYQITLLYEQGIAREDADE